MASQDYERFIFENSPFIPHLPEGFLDLVKRQIVEDPRHQTPPQRALSIDLRNLGLIHHQFLVNEVNNLYRSFDTSINDLLYYQMGFMAPLVLITAAFIMEFDGLAPAKQRIDNVVPADTEEKRRFKAYIHANLETCWNLMQEDTTCADIFDHLIARPYRPLTYYLLGLEIAKSVFGMCNMMLADWFGRLIGAN